MTICQPGMVTKGFFFAQLERIGAQLMYTACHYNTTTVVSHYSISRVEFT